MKRLFVAIKVEPEQTLVETFERFRKWFGKENITWADAGNFHITLKFIGDTAEQEIPAIKSALKKVADNIPLSP
jgi:2'-5' RNA ligase